MKKILLIAALLILAGCTDEPNAARVLSEAGYSQIVPDGYRFTGCGKEDSFHTGFHALGPSGRPTKGVVCSNLFKSSTIRLD